MHFLEAKNLVRALSKQLGHPVANLIREGKDHHIRSQLVSGEEFLALDAHLAQLVKEKKVERDVARHVCQDQRAFLDLLK
jgi:Tfp pilus assembly pilus retraction ATPase PilT